MTNITSITAKDNNSSPGDIRIILEGGKVSAPYNLRGDTNLRTLNWNAPADAHGETTYELIYTSATDTQRQIAHTSQTQIETNLKENKYRVTIRALKNGNYSDTPPPLCITRCATAPEYNFIKAPGQSAHIMDMVQAGDLFYVSNWTSAVWTTPKTGGVLSEQFRISGLYYASSMLLIDDLLYVGSFAIGGELVRMKFSTRGPEETLIQNAGSVTGLATDGTYVYASSYTGRSVIRMKIDASGRSGIDDSYIVGIGAANGVAVDDKYIYVTEADNRSLTRVSKTKDTFDRNFITGFTKPCGVAVHKDFIYIADAGTGKVVRANKGGSDIDRSFLSGFDGPSKVKVDDEYIYVITDRAISRSSWGWKTETT
ncbi:hypothetical protein [Streptomyces luteireticuli]|uniref:hypothetical protein n=1 Tax=Streptomyces luteireticuli TaxID=173858 RepID=UPI0035587985